jgi:hypothetical protein
MKLGLLIAASAALSLSAAATAWAGPYPFTVEWGQPDFPNYLSPPGPVSCDWTSNAYFRQCWVPAQADPPAVAAPAPKPTRHVAKVKHKAKG